MRETWVVWTPRGRDPYTNPKSKVAHAATHRYYPGDDAFPLACGRFAPSGFDAEIVADPHTPHCKRCQKALDKRDQSW